MSARWEGVSSSWTAPVRRERGAASNGGRAWLGSLAAYGALATIEARQVDALPAGTTVRVSPRVSPERVVTEEIALRGVNH